MAKPTAPKPVAQQNLDSVGDSLLTDEELSRLEELYPLKLSGPQLRVGAVLAQFERIHNPKSKLAFDEVAAYINACIGAAGENGGIYITEHDIREYRYRAYRRLETEDENRKLSEKAEKEVQRQLTVDEYEKGTN